MRQFFALAPSSFIEQFFQRGQMFEVEPQHTSTKPRKIYSEHDLRTFTGILPYFQTKPD